MLDRPELQVAAEAPPAGHRLDLDGIRVRYGSAVAVDGVSLSVEPGEILALLGPSGCGKTTLLRTVAGFIRPDGGRVLVDGHAIDHLPPGKRGVGIVFQSYALFPHMSVAENVAYGLEARGRPRAEIARRVEAALAAVRMDSFGERRPRAAVARHLGALQRGDDGARLARRVQQDGGGGAAVHRAVPHAAEQDEGARRAHLEGDGQQQRHGERRPDAGQHAHRRAEQAA